MEGIAFEVAGERFSVELDSATDMASTALAFANGRHTEDVDELERRGLDRRWLAGSRALADQINEWRAKNRTDAIALDGHKAEAAYAVLSKTPSIDSRTDHGRQDLWEALGRYLGNPLGQPGP